MALLLIWWKKGTWTGPLACHWQFATMNPVLTSSLIEPLKIESNHATRAYIHHRSWLGYTPCKVGMFSCWTVPVLFLLGLCNPRLCEFVRIVGFCPWCVCVRCGGEVRSSLCYDPSADLTGWVHCPVWKVLLACILPESCFLSGWEMFYLILGCEDAAQSLLFGTWTMFVTALSCLEMLETTMGGPQPSLRPPMNQQQFLSSHRNTLETAQLTDLNRWRSRCGNVTKYFTGTWKLGCWRFASPSHDNA